MRRIHTALLVLLTASPAAAQSRPLIYSPEGNRLRRYDIATIDAPVLREDVLIDRANSGPNGRDVNGPVCLIPDGSNRFIMGEDTGQPAIPPGWGVFEADGTQVGKLAATYFVSPGDPFGCVFDSEGRLFTTEIGNDATGPLNGQLIVWFPPFDRFPGPPGTYPNDARSTNFCKIASNIGTSTGVAIDEENRIYVASARTGQILRFSPPFPTAPDAAGGCGGIDALGSPVADSVRVETFVADSNVPTPTYIARAANGNWYVASVFSGTIGEYDSSGTFVQLVLPHPEGEVTFPLSTGHPQGLAVDVEGNLYYADLQLRLGPGGFGPGPNGKVWRIRFVEGAPQPPEIVREGLAFPDSVSILNGRLDLCYGDCDRDGKVGVDELVHAVGITLGHASVEECELLDANLDGNASIADLATSVDVSLNGCPSPTDGGEE